MPSVEDHPTAASYFPSRGSRRTEKKGIISMTEIVLAAVLGSHAWRNTHPCPLYTLSPHSPTSCASSLLEAPPQS